MEIQDCIIVGGGPAGLNAAVVLGRCGRKVLLFDSKKYRNQYSHGMHNYLTQDDILPLDFIAISRKEMDKYGVQLKEKKVIRSRKNKDGLFEVCDEDNITYYAKKLLIATGLTDNLPTIEGFEEMYGSSVYHCPYCDGWEVRGRALGVYAKNKNGWELALTLKGWSEDVTLYTDGKINYKEDQEELLKANDVKIVTDKIAKLKGDNGHIQKVVLKNGNEIDCGALFFVNGYTQHCNLAETFGCDINKKGVIVTNLKQETDTDGLFVAGDASKDMHFVVVAASEGAKAGVVINKELQKEISIKNLDVYRKKKLMEV